MSTVLPGFNPNRILQKSVTVSRRCELNLNGLSILTEAATGAYVITPVMAAMAGAEVFAVTRTTRFGGIEDVREATMELASLAGVSSRIQVLDAIPNDIVREADIITNSGHLRPIDAAMVACMKQTAVIPLMYEAWEFRHSDLDLAACRRRGIAIAGTNERHPSVDVFSFLGLMGVKLLLDAGIAAYGNNILLLCDNPFGPFLEAALRKAGADLTSAPRLGAAETGRDEIDAILVALHPRETPVLKNADVEKIARDFSRACVVQFWGDLDRQSLSSAGIPFWPQADVAPGHMGILPSAIGPDAVIQLQCGGLKVGEIMATAARRGEDPVAAAVTSGFGQALIIES